MNINKADFIKKLKEATIQPLGATQQSGKQNPFATISDPKQMDQIKKNVADLESLKARLQKLGMVQEDIDEALNMGKDYESQTEFYRDMIDDLMNRYYGVTYYEAPAEEKKAPVEKPVDDPQLSLFPKKEKPTNLEPEEKTKPISQMSADEYNEFVRQRAMYGHNNLFYVISRVKHAEEELKNGANEKTSNPLRIPYLALMDTKRTMEEVKINEQNFANSNIFRIIAESETPKISKQEILEFLNSK